MIRRHRATVLAAAALGAGALVLAATASGRDGGGDRHGGSAGYYGTANVVRGDDGDRGRRAAGAFLEATLAGSVPTDPALHGVSPGGAPWRIDESEVRISRDGSFRLEVEGLVIPSLGNPGPVKTVAAALFCGADTTAAATTPQVPLSSRGDAEIEAHVSLPSSCLAPVVLVQPNGSTSAYIAVSGFRS